MIVRTLWNDFADKALPDDAPPEQRREMERAYYMGFLSALQWANEAAALPDPVAEQAIAQAHRECEEFFGTVLLGGVAGEYKQ